MGSCTVRWDTAVVAVPTEREWCSPVWTGGALALCDQVLSYTVVLCGLSPRRQGKSPSLVLLRGVGAIPLSQCNKGRHWSCTFPNASNCLHSEGCPSQWRESPRLGQTLPQDNSCVVVVWLAKWSLCLSVCVNSRHSEKACQLSLKKASSLRSHN